MGQNSLWLPEGEEALEYLRKQRHLSDDVIKKFQFGFCPRDVDHELAGRIIMPIFDVHGSLVAFSSRDWKAPKKFQHWHESYDKSLHLYGLNFAKKVIQWCDKAIVVEGQFDTACLHSYGMTMAVGAVGTALTINHIALLSRYCSEIYLMFDPVESGEKATESAMHIYADYCLGLHGVTFIPVKLSDGLDPDDYIVKYGRVEMIHLLEKAKAEVS